MAWRHRDSQSEAEGKGTSSMRPSQKKAGWPGRHLTAITARVVRLAEGNDVLNAKNQKTREGKEEKGTRSEKAEGWDGNMHGNI